MHYGEIPFEERLKENIRQYRSADLYDLQIVGWQLRQLCEQYGFELLLTDRHGEKAVEMTAPLSSFPIAVISAGISVSVGDFTASPAVSAGQHQCNSFPHT